MKELRTAKFLRLWYLVVRTHSLTPNRATRSDGTGAEPRPALDANELLVVKTE